MIVTLIYVFADTSCSFPLLSSFSSLAVFPRIYNGNNVNTILREIRGLFAHLCAYEQLVFCNIVRNNKRLTDVGTEIYVQTSLQPNLSM